MSAESAAIAWRPLPDFPLDLVPETELPRLLSVKDLAKWSGCSERSMYNFAHRLPAYCRVKEFGRRVLVRQDALRRYLDQQVADAAREAEQ